MASDLHRNRDGSWFLDARFWGCVMSGYTKGPWTPYPGPAMPSLILGADGVPVAAACNYKPADVEANVQLIASAPDHAQIARALCAGFARWEKFPSGDHGEFCIGGMRYATKLDEFGVPVMTNGMRAAIAAATGEQP